MRTEIKFGLVFINLDDAAAPLERFLDGAMDSFKRVLDEVPLEVFHYNRAELNSNWKAWHETNMDLYHENMHVVLRKTQINAMPMEDRRLVVFKNGHGASAGLKAKYDGYAGFADRGDDVSPLPGMSGDDFQFVDLFPSTTIVARGSVIRIDTATPLSPGRIAIGDAGPGR